MESPTNPYVQIIYYTKEGHRYSRKIEFETDEDCREWDFSKFVLDRIQFERGMFPTDESQFISIDIIARIEYEAYYGVPF